MPTRPKPMPGAKQPGGRPRGAPARSNAFARWITATKQSVSGLADKLGISAVSVYHLRDGRFAPGRDLAVRIASESGGAVPVDSWGTGRPRARARRRRATGKATAKAERSPPATDQPATAAEDAPAAHASDEGLTLAFLLLEYIIAPGRPRPYKIPEADHDRTAARWALAIDELAATGVAYPAIQRAIEHAQRPGSRWRSKVNNGAALLRWWPQLSDDLG